MAKQQQEGERREKPENSHHYRPDESSRLKLAREWLRVARGESPAREEGTLG